jgi:hypothetical protein
MDDSRSHGARMPSVSRVPLILAALCVALPLGLYVATLAPTVTWRNDGRDSGDLVSAICTLGIAHPPGYPVFVILGRLFLLLPFGDPAYRVNLMSAFFAACAVATVYLVARAELRAARNKDGGRIAGTRSASVEMAAMAAALSFAISPIFWSQATVAEVYSLTSLLGGGSALLTVVATRYAGPRLQPVVMATLGLVAGLSLSHHLALAIWLAGLAVWLLMERPDLLRKRESLLPLLAGLALGLSAYLYLPLRAAAHPAANWGDPETLARFLWTATAEPYRGLIFGLSGASLATRVSTVASLLSQQFGWIGLALGLAGIWVAAREHRPFLAFSAIVFVGLTAYSASYNSRDSYVYLIPSYQVMAVWLALGTCWLLDALAAWRPRARGRPGVVVG